MLQLHQHQISRFPLLFSHSCFSPYLLVEDQGQGFLLRDFQFQFEALERSSAERLSHCHRSVLLPLLAGTLAPQDLLTETRGLSVQIEVKRLCSLLKSGT